MMAEISLSELSKNRGPLLYTVSWDGTSGAGMRVSSGIYPYVLKAETFSESRKMRLIK